LHNKKERKEKKRAKQEKGQKEEQCTIKQCILLFIGGNCLRNVKQNKGKKNC